MLLGYSFSINNDNGNLVLYLSKSMIDKIKAGGSVTAGGVAALLFKGMQTTPYTPALSFVAAANWASVLFYANAGQGVSIKINSFTIVLIMQSERNIYM